MWNPLAIHLLGEDAHWRHLQIGPCRFYWPRAYPMDRLAGTYYEVFAPPLINPHCYEAGQVRIRPGDWVVDAGAGEGFFVHYALQRGANVVAIEPTALLVEGLRRTFSHEVRAGRVLLVQGALGAQPGLAALTQKGSDVFASTVEHGDTEAVRIHTLDELVEQGIAPRIGFVKMDIENAEVAAVRGAGKLLLSQRPRLSIAVYHRAENAGVIRGLLRHLAPGYRARCSWPWWMPGNALPRASILYANWETPAR
jgi:FkbM family methyltransferase